jgi:hypothetical protein
MSVLLFCCAQYAEYYVSRRLHDTRPACIVQRNTIRGASGSDSHISGPQKSCLPRGKYHDEAVQSYPNSLVRLMVGLGKLLYPVLIHAQVSRAPIPNITIEFDISTFVDK